MPRRLAAARVTGAAAMVIKAPTFYEQVTAAIRHFQRFGFTSQAELDEWVQRLRRAALLKLQTPEQTEREITAALHARYTQAVTKGGLERQMPALPRFTIEKVKPQLRRELDRRISVSASLIKLNRDEAISTTMRRFQGWATSIPPGGSKIVDVKDEKDNVRRALTNLPFHERRVVIDQTHKLVDAITNIVAVEGGAIAARWHSPWRRQGYAARKDHKSRDELVFAIRDCWAIQKGLMKAGPNGFTDQIERPGEFVFCSCTYEYLFYLTSLPLDMLTKAGMYTLPIRSTAGA